MKRRFILFIYILFLYIILISFSFLNINYLTEKNDLLFLRIIKNNFYISTSYYDDRFNITRILISFNPIGNYSITITDINAKQLNYSIVLYDKCIKSERFFPLKYGNIIVKKRYDNLYINYINKSYLLKINMNKITNNKYSTIWCLTSLRNQYDAVIQFNQTISLSIKYGVERIILYYSDVSIRIMKLIKKYKDNGIIDVYYWKENEESCNMKICGKLLQLNDCLYKSIYIADYIINVDIDEIIIPKIHSNYYSLLRYSSNKYPYSNMYIFYTKLCIKSVSIYNETRKTPKDYMKLPKVMDTNIYTIKNCCTVSVIKTACSKYIIKPSAIVALWLHDIWSGDYNYTIIPDTVAYTRHTRHLSFGLKNVCYNYSDEKLFSA